MLDDECTQHVELPARALDGAAFGAVRVHLRHAALAAAARSERLAGLVERGEVSREVRLASFEQAAEGNVDALGLFEHGGK